jgi:hypothetical protein
MNKLSHDDEKSSETLRELEHALYWGCKEHQSKPLNVTFFKQVVYGIFN